jgi:hypothetical protein
LGVKPSHVFAVVLAGVLVLALLDIFASVITAIFGMLYPAYMSFKVQLLKYRPSKRITNSRRKYG